MFKENEEIIIHTFKLTKESLPKRWHSIFFPSKSTIYRRAKKEKEWPPIIVYQTGAIKHD